MPSVLILLAVYQGERFLEEQLQSLAGQSWDDIHVLASDDGSDDRSLEILETAQRSWAKGTFKIVAGPRSGYAANFRSLLQNTDIEADYFAFCDQDDIWDRDKIADAVAWHADQDHSLPIVCGTRSRIIDETGNFIELSPLRRKPPSFQNAIVENIVPGHTMVMNRKARDLLVQTGDYIGSISHDYWIYLIVTGAGGIFHNSPKPSVSYRQHQGNQIGYRRNWRGHFWRLNRVIKGEVRKNSERRITALEDCAELLTPAARNVLRDYKILHNSDSIWERYSVLTRSGIYRQSLLGRIGLKVDCLYGLL